MDKSPDAFRTISEVAEWLGVQAHVLRFWESKFNQVKPVKRAGGRRYYRPADMELLGGIKKLLHDDGLTVKGVQKVLSSEGVGHVSALSQELCEVAKDSVGESADAPATALSSEKAQSSEGTATVVPFKSAQAASDLQADQPEALLETAADPVSSAQTSAAEPADEPETSDQISDPVLTSDQIIAPPPNAPSISSTPSESDEKPILPSFLHRTAPEAQPVEPAPTASADAKDPAKDSLPSFLTATPSTAEPPAEPAKHADAAEDDSESSMVVDAPDPPNESEIPYSQGPLAHLAAIDVLSDTQLAGIAPLAQELKSWLSRASGTAPH